MMNILRKKKKAVVHQSDLTQKNNEGVRTVDLQGTGVSLFFKGFVGGGGVPTQMRSV